MKNEWTENINRLNGYYQAMAAMNPLPAGVDIHELHTKSGEYISVVVPFHKKDEYTLIDWASILPNGKAVWMLMGEDAPHLDLFIWGYSRNEAICKFMGLGPVENISIPNMYYTKVTAYATEAGMTISAHNVLRGGFEITLPGQRFPLNEKKFQFVLDTIKRWYESAIMDEEDD